MQQYSAINESVNDVKDLKRVVKNAKSGTQIILDPNKSYACNEDTTIELEDGVENVSIIGFGPAFNQRDFNPKSPRDGRAVIKGKGELTFNASNKLLITGFFFRLRFVMHGCDDCKVEYSDFTYDPKGKNHCFMLTNGKRNRIFECEFHDKDNEGYFLGIRDSQGDKEKTKDNVVERCVFRDHRYHHDGGEPLVIGNSNQKTHSLLTKVIRCWFKDLKSDPETISIKSCDNTIESCCFENNDSSITVRHGHTNYIKGCVFRGSGGIRLYGKDNEVLDNYFLDNAGESKYRPIRLENGTKIDEESKEKGSYTQVWSNKIIGNWFVNCKMCVRCGNGGRKYMPESCNFQDNTIIADEGVKSNALEFRGRGRVKAKPRKGDNRDNRDNKFRNNTVYGNVEYYIDKNKDKDHLKNEEKDILKRSYQVKTDRPKVNVPDVLGNEKLIVKRITRRYRENKWK